MEEASSPNNVDKTNANNKMDPIGLESMTQDSIGWDESNNLDLRKLASPSFSTTQQSLTLAANTPRVVSLNKEETSLSNFAIENRSIVNNRNETDGIDTPVIKSKETHRVAFRDIQNFDDTLGARKRCRRSVPGGQNISSISNESQIDSVVGGTSESNTSKQETTGGSEDFEDLLDSVQTPSPVDNSTSKSNVKSGHSEEKNGLAELPSHVIKSPSRIEVRRTTTSLDTNFERTSFSEDLHSRNSSANATEINSNTNMQKFQLCENNKPNSKFGSPHQPSTDQQTCNQYKPVHTSKLQSTFVQSQTANSPIEYDSNRTEISNNGCHYSDDEFDDFNLGMTDLENVDSLVIAATQQPEYITSIKERGVDGEYHRKRLVFADDDNPKSSPLDVPKDQSTSSLHDAIKVISGDNDEFEDLPDIDFAALDEALSQSQIEPTAEVQSTPQIKSYHFVVPPPNAAIQNSRTLPSCSAETNFLTFHRYKVLFVDVDFATRTKSIAVVNWRTEMIKNDEAQAKRIHHSDRFNDEKKAEWEADGTVHLRGEWYETNVCVGDNVHLCSLTGQFRTDHKALPITLHTCPPGNSVQDDLVLVVHPDLLLTPTIISETVSCTRRAIIKTLIGSTGLTSKSALFGTMRHQLFEATMIEKDFTKSNIWQHIKAIVRDNAEGILSCNTTSAEASKEVIKVFEQLNNFVTRYTSFLPDQNGSSHQAIVESHSVNSSSTTFLIEEVEAVEEPLVSPELGLKGNIDMIAHARFGSNDPKSGRALVGIELKTGHSQKTHNAHLAQLALYILMMKSRYGVVTVQRATEVCAAESGILLYLNNESVRAVNVAPSLAEIKSLIFLRNLVATEQVKATTPREVTPLNEQRTDISTTVARFEEYSSSDLPAVLSSSHTCNNCYVNRQCMMFAAATSALSAQNVSDPTNVSHRELLNRLTGHLNNDDFRYFSDWKRLIDLEAHAGGFHIAESWLVDAKQRESDTSKTISGLSYVSNDSRILVGLKSSLITFTRSNLSVGRSPLCNLAFDTGSRVVISTDSVVNTEKNGNGSIPEMQIQTNRRKMHLVTGMVESTSNSDVVIRADKHDLNRIQKASIQSNLFRIDKDERASGTGTLIQNLFRLFTGDDIPLDSSMTSTNPAERTIYRLLRDIIIRYRPPVFDLTLEKNMFDDVGEVDDVGVPGCDLLDLALEFACLNPDQQAAVIKVVTARDFTIIQGMPGTGKTSTVVFIVRLLVARGKRVLISSYTHGAVDNVLLKLVEKGLTNTCSNNTGATLIRVGLKSSCHPEILPYLASNVAKSLESQTTAKESDVEPSAEALKKAVSNARVVGVTALSAPRSALLQNEFFDVVIVDEAGQITQPAVLGSLMLANSFVLVGDHMQLPPLVKSEAAIHGGFGVSMLMALAEKYPDSVAQLTIQYRMHQHICQVSNIIAYDGKLKCANPSVASQKLDLKSFGFNLLETSKLWLRHTIDPSHAVVFVDTDKVIALDINGMESFQSYEHTVDRREGGSIVNTTEARLVRMVVDNLMDCGLDAPSIGVISPFRAQLRLLNEQHGFDTKDENRVEISTIDRFQGRDKDVVIISFVRCNGKGKVGKLLQDFRRLNVALSRAKSKVIMIGSFSTLHKGSDVLRPVLDVIRDNNWIVKAPNDAD